MSKPLERWHGAHHYSEKVHLFLVAFLFFAVITFLWSYFTLSAVNLNKQNPGPSEDKPVPSATVTPTPTCLPRPACLDSNPRCLIAETENMCPPSMSPTLAALCTQEAKLCPDEKTWVGRSGPNCEFSKCPLR